MMGFKKFLIGVIKNLIVLLVATFVFSAVTIDFPNFMKGVFGDIFEYASPDARKQVVSQLAETCSSLDQGANLVTLNQICINASLLDSMRENCQNYRELKRRNVKIENEAQVRETCQQIESGEFERACNEIEGKSSLTPDFSKIGDICKDYKSGKIDDKEFFFRVISSALPSQVEIPQIGFLEKYNQTISYLNNNKILYFVVLVILLIILYLLITNINLFIATLMQISFSIGILIMLPYFAILAYDKFVGINTTPILGSMFGNVAAFDPKAVISVVLLLFLRTYNSLIITLGIVFLVIGIAGRIYGFVLRRKSRAIETKKIAKIKKKRKV